MTERKFKVWLDSGANHDSAFKTKITLSEIGVSSEEWDAMSEDEREELMRDIAFQNSDWGFSEIGADDDDDD